MSDRVSIRLWEPQRAYQDIKRLWGTAKALLLAGHRLVLELKPETRSLKQNALLHAMLADVARQVEWAGAKRDPETWKRLLTAAWLRARGESIEVLPALDGHGIDVVFRRTSDLSRAECCELCDFIAAWAAEQSVEFSESRQWQVDPETGEIA